MKRFLVSLLFAVSLMAQYPTPGGGSTSSGSSGDVTGPASSTADAVALFSGTTGKILKDGLPTQGTGAKLIRTTGTPATNDCAKFDSNGNIVSNGAACASGSATLSPPYISSGGILYGPVFTMTDPSLPSYTWVNQGDATLTTSNGAQILCAPSSGGAVDINARVVTAPATPYTITAAILVSAPAVNYTRVGIGFRQSSSGKLTTLGATLGNSFNVDNWGSATGFSDSPGTIPWASSNGLKWFRITDNGTNLVFSVGESPDMFYQVFSVSRTAFLTTTGPDQVLFFVNSNSGYSVCGTLLSWKQT